MTNEKVGAVQAAEDEAEAHLFGVGGEGEEVVETVKEEAEEVETAKEAVEEDLVVGGGEVARAEEDEIAVRARVVLSGFDTLSFQFRYG